MPPRRTGYIEPYTDAGGRKRFRARLRLADGSRPRIDVPEGYSEARAREWAAAMQEREDERGGRLKAKQATEAGAEGETVEAWSNRWLATREAKGLSSVKETRGRLKNHVLSLLGAKPMRAVTKNDLEGLVEALDARMTSDGKYGWKTAVHIWSDVAKMFKDACTSKRRELRVRDDNPAQGVAGPDRGGKKALQYLWPSEFLAFVRSPAVPLEWRRLLALSTYLFCRPEELEALEWTDVDLEHGTVHIHRAVDRVRNVGVVKETKTGIARRTPIEPLAYFATRATNGMTEGFNGKAKLVKRRAYGYRSFRNYRLRLLNACA